MASQIAASQYRQPASDAVLGQETNGSTGNVSTDESTAVSPSGVLSTRRISPATPSDARRLLHSPKQQRGSAASVECVNSAISHGCRTTPG